jgi:glycosyltransferase involved in cell wall biosynthesis
MLCHPAGATRSINPIAGEGSPLTVHVARFHEDTKLRRTDIEVGEPHLGHQRLAFLLDSLKGGGVQRMTLAIAIRCSELGHAVDLLVCNATGPLRDMLPTNVRLVPLSPSGAARTRLTALRADPAALPALLLPILLAPKPHWAFAYLAALAEHLREERPDALFASTPRLNIVAVLARRLAGVPSRLLVSERTAPSCDLAHGNKWRKRVLLPPLMRHAYAQAEAIIAVSDGVGNDLARVTGLPRDRIRIVYNAVVGPELEPLSRRPVDHPWFRPGAPPVVLSVARLSDQKDLATLLRAFACFRANRPARLLVLGEGGTPEQTAQRLGELRRLAGTLGIGDDVELPGFIMNPYAYMARAKLFVLSSAWEGFGNVLVEAMACGCPVVSTDCPSGPREILDDGRYGPLVPVGDDLALAAAMERVFVTPPDLAALRARAAEFTVDRATTAYLKALFGSDMMRPTPGSHEAHPLSENSHDAPESLLARWWQWWRKIA